MDLTASYRNAEHMAKAFQISLTLRPGGFRGADGLEAIQAMLRAAENHGENMAKKKTQETAPEGEVVLAQLRKLLAIEEKAAKLKQIDKEIDGLKEQVKSWREQRKEALAEFNDALAGQETMDFEEEDGAAQG